MAIDCNANLSSFFGRQTIRNMKYNKISRKLLLHWILRLSYFYSLFIGLFPAPINWFNSEFQHSRIYQAYSLAMHSVCLVVITVNGYYLHEKNYMPGDPVLKWTYTVTNVTKIVAVTFLIVDIWYKRRRLMAAWQAYLDFVQRYRHFQMPAESRGKRGSAYFVINRRIENYIVSKFFTATAYTLLISGFFLKMHPVYKREYPVMLAFNFLLIPFLFSAMDQFFFVLCQLYRQFSYVNAELQFILKQLRQLALEFHSCPKDTAAVADAFELSEFLALRLSSLSAMHFECYCLTQRIFRLCESASAAILLRIFTTNVRIVYQAVLFVNHSLASDIWTNLNSSLLTLCFYCDAGLLLGVLQGVLTSCNETGQLVRECCELLLELREFDCLTRVLEQFADHLRCYKLQYKICGLFEFNNQASLRYFLIVFVQVSVLVQFDLKSKLE